MPDTPGLRTGGCLCGGVRYRATGPIRDVIACHCRTCRRQSGHVWAATSAPRGAITIEGADNLTWFAATPAARRGFCAICGSLLFWEPADADRLSFAPGSLDDDAGLTLSRHIYVAEKGDYYPRPDDAPCFEADSPADRP